MNFVFIGGGSANTEIVFKLHFHFLWCKMGFIWR